MQPCSRKDGQDTTLHMQMLKVKQSALNICLMVDLRHSTAFFAPINSTIVLNFWKQHKVCTEKTGYKSPVALRGNWCKWTALATWFTIELGTDTWKLLFHCDLMVFNWWIHLKTVWFSRGDLMSYTVRVAYFIVLHVWYLFIIKLS